MVGLVLDYVVVSGNSRSWNVSRPRGGGGERRDNRHYKFRVLTTFANHVGGPVYALCANNVPLPLDHFFFCFLPPVAAGACARLVPALPHS